MFVQRAAIRPVPPYAIVDENAVGHLEESLAENQDALQEMLDTGYRELDRQQPTLAQYLAAEVSGRSDELAQSVGYFLVVAVYLAFKEAFPTRLGSVDQDALRAALFSLETDEELRAEDPREVLDSDDVVAMGQPAVLEFVQHHLQEAVEQSGEDASLEDLDRIYRAVLVEVIALTHAVSSPTGSPPGSEVLA